MKKKLMATVLAGIMAFMVPLEGFSDGKTIIPLPSNWCGTGHCSLNLLIPPPIPPPQEHLNQTLWTHSQKQSVTVYNKMSNHQITSADYASEATILSAMFDNWDKAGFTKTLETLIVNNPGMFETAPTNDQLHKGWLLIENTGLYATESDYDTYMLNSVQQQGQALVSFVQTNGLAALHAALVQEFQSLANNSRNQRDGVTLRLAKCKVPWASMAGLYLSIAALVVTGPVGVAIAVVGIASGGAGLLGGC